MREIRLMNEYSVDFPIWDEHGLVDPADYPLSTELTADLRAWAATFNDRFEPFDGWDDPGIAAEQLTRGPALRDRLQAALGPDCRIALHQWQDDTEG